jgi:tRNA G18 (ribose-2'-O)-methylase SpoU
LGVPLEHPIHESAEEVRATLAPLRHDFSVALYAAGNPFAVGAIIRVAHNFLAREVILIGDAPWYAKGAMGMDKYEEIRVFGGEDAFLEHVSGRPVWGVEKDHARRSLHAVRGFPPGVVFLFGSERFGLPESALASCDEVVGIPIFGVNHSLPLAIAAGIVMNEWARQAYAGGKVR